MPLCAWLASKYQRNHFRCSLRAPQIKVVMSTVKKRPNPLTPSCAAPHRAPQIKVVMSTVKHKIFIGSLARDVTKDSLEEQLRASPDVKGLEEVDLVMDPATGPGGKPQNRGFAFLTFYNHECAQLAMKAFTRSDFRLAGRDVVVSWAEPKRSEQKATVPDNLVKSVYVGNLSDAVTDEELRVLLGRYGDVERVQLLPNRERPGKHRDYGFVHFGERSSALSAIDSAAADKPTLHGQLLTIRIAKPNAQDPTRGGVMSGGYGYMGGPGQQGGRGQVRAGFI